MEYIFMVEHQLDKNTVIKAGSIVKRNANNKNWPIYSPSGKSKVGPVLSPEAVVSLSDAGIIRLPQKKGDAPAQEADISTSQQAINILKEMNAYLNENDQNYIGHGSKFHSDMDMLLNPGAVHRG